MANTTDFLEEAIDRSLEYYMMVSGVKQALLNISAVTLYHLFEQHLLFFLRREILHPFEENDIDLMKVSVFKKRCLEYNIDVEQFSTWQKLHEMRLVANAVKHAEGKSAGELRKIRPDLFKNPALEKYEFKFGENFQHLYLPLAGEDLYLSLRDLKNYRDTISNFWNEMLMHYMTASSSILSSDDKKLPRPPKLRYSDSGFNNAAVRTRKHSVWRSGNMSHVSHPSHI